MLTHAATGSPATPRFTGYGFICKVARSAQHYMIRLFGNFIASNQINTFLFMNRAESELISLLYGSLVTEMGNRFSDERIETAGLFMWNDIAWFEECIQKYMLSQVKSCRQLGAYPTDTAIQLDRYVSMSTRLNL